MPVSREDALSAVSAPRHSAWRRRPADARYPRLRPCLPPFPPTADDPLTRPIAVEQAQDWLRPAPPVRVFGKTYLVGFGGLSVALIDTGDGLILIDGALPQAEPAILANIRKLGFDPRRIRYILSTEPHFDHAGGLAALVRDTGATVVASVRGAEGLRSGRLAADDPQRGYDSRFPRGGGGAHDPRWRAGAAGRYGRHRAGDAGSYDGQHELELARLRGADVQGHRLRKQPQPRVRARLSV